MSSSPPLPCLLFSFFLGLPIINPGHPDAGMEGIKSFGIARFQGGYVLCCGNIIKLIESVCLLFKHKYPIFMQFEFHLANKAGTLIFVTQKRGMKIED